jgi:tetratricopeptide (TPR) repeat protein
MGNRWDIARTLNHLGEVAWELKDWEDARRSYLAALRTAFEAKATPSVLTALFGLAMVLKREGNQEQALELCYHIMQHPASGKETYERAHYLYDQLLAETSIKQGPALNDQLGLRPFDLVVGSLVAMRAPLANTASRSYA